MSAQGTSRIVQDFVPFHRLSSKYNPALCFAFVVANHESKLVRIHEGVARREASVYL